MGLRKVFKWVLIGAFSGYFILHPLVMVTGHLMMEPNTAHSGLTFLESVFLEISKIFSLSMLPWGLAFVLFGSAIGFFYGKRAYAEQMLCEIEKRYRILMETSPVAIALTDLNSNFIMVNRQAALLHGFVSEEEMLASGKNGFDFFSPQDRQKAMEGIKTVIEKGILNNIECAMLRKDGSVFLAEVSVSLITSQDEEPEAFIVVVRDVSERKKAEEKLLWEAGVNAAIAELSSALISLRSVDDISRVVLDHAKRLTGSKYGYVGYIEEKTGYLICPTMTRDVWGVCQVQDKDICFKHFGGMWGWVLDNRKSLITNAPSEDPRSSGSPPGHIQIKNFLSAPSVIAGNLLGQVAIANAERDYTGRDLKVVERLADLYAIAIQHQRAEENIRQQHVFLNNVIESLPHPFYVIDANDYTIKVANAAARMDHRLQDDSTCYALTHESAQPCGTAEHICPLEQVKKTKRPVTVEHIHYDQDGNARNVEVHSFPILDDDGNVIQMIEYNFDITEKKQAEEKLLRAKEAAETGNRAKSKFLASMSHELRTPLNAIIGFSEVLQDRYFGDLNEKQTEYVKDIVESGKHLHSLLEDILDLTDLEAGKTELRLAGVDIGKLLEESLEMIKQKALDHDLSLDIHLPEEIANLKIQADERKLKQIMFNLLSNAAKFTPDGGSVRVSARIGDWRLAIGDLKEEDTRPQSTVNNQQSTIEISVADTGIGIAPEDQEKIFDEFYQVKGGIVDKTPGTGLGLSLTRQLVEMHGGKIWVESEGKGKGSRFSFMLLIK